MLDRLYTRLLALSQHPKALWVLALVAFAESGGGALGERPHVLGRRVVAWDGSTRPCPSCPARALPGPGVGARAPPAPKTQN